jgi:hypothetical protein
MIEIVYGMFLTEAPMLFTNASETRQYMYVTYMIRMIDPSHSMIASPSCRRDLYDMSLSYVYILSYGHHERDYIWHTPQLGTCTADEIDVICTSSLHAH